MRERPTFRRGARERPQPFSKADANKTPQIHGRMAEKELAKDLGGQQQPGSGCFDGKPGDILYRQFLIESKFTAALSYSLSIKTLRKISREAEQVGKTPAMVIEMSGGFYFPAEKWVVIPYEVFKELTGK